MKKMTWYEKMIVNPLLVLTSLSKNKPKSLQAIVKVFYRILEGPLTRRKWSWDDHGQVGEPGGWEWREFVSAYFRLDTTSEF